MGPFFPIVLVSTISSWFPTFIGISRFKPMETVWKMIAVFFVIMFFSEIFSLYLAHFYKNNIWLLNFNLLLEGVVYISALVYWKTNLSIQRIHLTTALIFLGYGFFTFTHATISTIPVHFTITRGLVLVLLASIVMIHRSRIAEANLLHDPVFLFASGILFHNSIGCLMDGISSIPELVANAAIRESSFKIYSFSNVIANLIYAYAIRCHQQSTRFSS